MNNVARNFVGLMAAASMAVALGACNESSPVAPETAGGNRLNRGLPQTQRSIDEFIQAQRGQALSWFGEGSGLTATVDYAGSVYRRIATEETPRPKFEGRVTEQWLPDGTVRVTVELNSTQVLTWAVEGANPRIDLVVFGERAEGSFPKNGVLGQSRLHAIFRNNAPGAPMPDLVSMIASPRPGQHVEYLSFSADALRESALTGAVATLHVDQPGLSPFGFAEYYGVLRAGDVVLHGPRSDDLEHWGDKGDIEDPGEEPPMIKLAES